MKLYLIIFSCIGITLYCAEKRLNPSEIIQKGRENGGFMDPETLHKLMQQQAAVLKEQELNFLKEITESYVAAKQLVPERTIEMVDAKTAERARAHNQKLQRQLLQNQRK